VCEREGQGGAVQIAPDSVPEAAPFPDPHALGSRRSCWRYALTAKERVNHDADPMVPPAETGRFDVK
jgi:hypothetical protein